MLDMYCACAMRKYLRKYIQIHNKIQWLLISLQLITPTCEIWYSFWMISAAWSIWSLSLNTSISRGPGDRNSEKYLINFWASTARDLEWKGIGPKSYINIISSPERWGSLAMIGWWLCLSQSQWDLKFLLVWHLPWMWKLFSIPGLRYFCLFSIISFNLIIPLSSEVCPSLLYTVLLYPEFWSLSNSNYVHCYLVT